MSVRMTLGVVLLSFATACAGKTAVAPDVAVSPASAAADTSALAAPVSAPLGLDPDVRTGKLSNGLTYYIRHHEQPHKRAMLWLAVHAGSVQEDDDQLGLAHFVEHMAFNGTERFAKNQLIDYVERAGMDFGADLNAYTSFDETVYTLTIPTDDEGVITTGLDILEDWSSALAFDPTEVDKERGVVIEEWRIGRGAGQRVFDKQWPILLEGSKYAHRKPIGEKHILESAPVERLRAYYKEWYRPDNMAVVIVGDIDPDRAEQEIKQRFSDNVNPEGARPRGIVPVPLLEKTRAAIVPDPEAQLASVALVIKAPVTSLVTEQDYRSELIRNLFHNLLGARLDEIGESPDAPFVFAFSFSDRLGQAVDTFRLQAAAKPGQADKATQVLVTEIERVRRHGFLASELERAKADVLRTYERAVAEKHKAESRAYAFEIVRHFLENEPMPGRDAELALARAFLPGITLAEVNALAEALISRKDRVVLASGPERDNIPNEAALLAILDGVSKQEIAAYTEAEAPSSLLAEAPKAGSVTSTETLPEIGVTIWTLSNGAKVVVKPTEFKNDEVLLRAFSPGGHSLVGNDVYHAASAAANIVSNGGLGQYDVIALRKFTAGKVANVNPWIGELEEGLSGSASPQDLELLFQLVHLTFTAPRRDEKAFQAWKAQTLTFVKNRDLNPQTVFFETLNEFSNNGHLRRQPWTEQTLANVELDDAFNVYRDRFADAGDFTFVFVGNVELAKLEQLASTYLATLPTTGRKETWKDVGVTRPKGTRSLEVKKGIDPKSFVYITFHGDAKWSPEAEDDLDLLAEFLDIRLREVLREDLSGVYGAFSRGNLERRPKQRYTYTIGFGCAPENVAKLEQAVFEVISAVKRSGVPEDYLTKLKEIRRRGLETDLERNRFWLNELSEHLSYGTDPRAIAKLQEKKLERVNSGNIQRAAKKFLGTNRIDGVLNPEVKPAAESKPEEAKAAANPG